MDMEIESDNKLFHNSIKYLQSISNLNSLNVPALKSFYSTKGRLMELRKAIYLPSYMTRTSIRCQRCFINLIDGPATYSIKAEQKKSKFAKKILAKSRHNKPLTAFQRKYLKKFHDFNGNQLAITCKFCKKESLIKLEKPKKTVHTKVNQNISRKKKKTKKKDKLCGLNEEAVKSLSTRNLRTSDGSISLSNNKTSGFKLSKKVALKKSQVQVTKESIKENTIKLQKKMKKFDKLNQVLNSPTTSKTTTKLKHFLQSL